ncbi:MAG: hypothetical protein Q9195_005606 [Heterodermia aff. obscurata]
MLLQLGIVLAVAFFHGLLATPIDSNASPAQQLNLDPSDSLTPTATLPSLNVSKTLNNSQAGATFLAHRFRVPNTNTVLGLGFGIIRHRIDATDLQSLLHLALAIAKENLDQYGGDAEYPLQPGFHQSFEQSSPALYRMDQSYTEILDNSTIGKVVAYVGGYLLGKKIKSLSLKSWKQ